MEINLFKGNSKDILNCATKDESGLNDFQKLPNQHGVTIPRVGIERFRIPLRFYHPEGLVMNHDTEASMFIFLSNDKTGVNMSRLCSILQEEATLSPIDKPFFRKILRRYRAELRDFKKEPLIPRSELVLKFSYPIKQKSLKSENWGWQYYNVEIHGVETEREGYYLDITVHYEYSSTCPCSLSMAKQYEKNFRLGNITEGTGIATAHGQRSQATVTCRVGVNCNFFFEELIALLRKTIPTETQSLVKRVDEQAFAILNGENPMFVEHVARRLSNSLEEEPRILDWKAKIEHFESLHSHNAVAYIQKLKH